MTKQTPHLRRPSCIQVQAHPPQAGCLLPRSRQIVDVKEPTLLPGSDSLASCDETHEVVLDSDVSFSRSLATSSSSGSRPSDGQLNKAFKFGGRPKAHLPPLPVAVDQHNKPQTLSDLSPRLCCTVILGIRLGLALMGWIHMRRSGVDLDLGAIVLRSIPRLLRAAIIMEAMQMISFQHCVCLIVRKGHQFWF
jgi:hypothetical protein